MSEQEEIIEEKEEKIEKEEVKKPIASRDSLIKRRYRKGEIETTLGRVFEIKSLDPKTMLLTRGSAFLPAFNDFVENQDPQSLGDPEISDFMDDICCVSITSINFVKKSLEECTEEETPIEVLDLDEKVEIFSAVMDMSSTEDERAEWHFFPGHFAEQSESEVPTS